MGLEIAATKIDLESSGHQVAYELPTNCNAVFGINVTFFRDDIDFPRGVVIGVLAYDVIKFLTLYPILRNTLKLPTFCGAPDFDSAVPEFQ